MPRGPRLLAIALTLALGIALVWPSVQTGGVPDTWFTDGHLLAQSLGPDGLLSSTRVEGGAAFRPLLWPFALLAGLVGAIGATTLIWVSAPVLNAVGGAALARSLGSGPHGAALAGLLLAWSPWVRTTLGNGQPEQAHLGPLALTWAAALSGRWAPVLTPLALLLALTATPNLGMAAALGLPVLLVATRAPLRRGLGVLVAAVPAGLLGLAYHAAALGEASVFSPRQAPPQALHFSSQDLVGWNAAHSFQLSDATLGSFVQPLGPVAFEAPVAHAPYLGLVLLALAGVATVRLRGRAIPLLITAGLALVLALGETGGLMSLVYALVPAVESSSSAFRMVSGALVALAALVGVGLDDLLRRRAGLFLLPAALAWGEAFALPNHGFPMPARPAVAHPELAALGSGGPVLDLPVGTRGCQEQLYHYLNGALVHERGFLHGGGPLAESTLGTRAGGLRHAAAHPQTCAAKVQQVVADLGVEAVVLHEHQRCPSEGWRRCLVEAFGEPAGDARLAWWILGPEAAPVPILAGGG